MTYSQIIFLILLLPVLCIVVPLTLYVQHHQRSSWRHFATAHKLVYQSSSKLSFLMKGVYQGRTLQLVNGFRRRSHDTPRTRMKVSLNINNPDLKFLVSKGASLISSITTDRVMSGAPDFDKEVEITGKPQAQVTKMMQSTQVRLLFQQGSRHPGFDRFEVADNFLEVQGPFYLQNPAQLKQFLAQLYELATAIETEVNASSIHLNLDESH